MDLSILLQKTNHSSRIEFQGEQALLRCIKDQNYYQYSPFGWGVLIALSSLIGLAMLSYKSINVSVLLYLSIGAMLAGIALQIRSRRIIYIRIYQMMIVFMQAVIFSIGAILLLIEDQKTAMKLVIVTMVVTLFIGLVVFSFFRTRRVYASISPYGPFGVMNPKTGIVDPTHSIPKIQKQIDKYDGKTNLVWRLIPLTAGLALAFVGALSLSGKELVWAIGAIVIVAGDSLGIGSLAAYAAATLRWERKHGKYIIVKC